MDVPSELLLPILMCLTVSEAGRVACCCRKLAAVARSEELWKRFAASHAITESAAGARGRFRSAVLRAIREPRDWVWRGDYHALQFMSWKAGAAPSAFTALAVLGPLVACGASNGQVSLYFIDACRDALALRTGIVTIGDIAQLGQVTAVAIHQISLESSGVPAAAETFEVIASGASGALVVADVRTPSPGEALQRPQGLVVAHPHHCPVACVLPPCGALGAERLAVTADLEGRACLWDWPVKTVRAQWNPHPGAAVAALVWAPAAGPRISPGVCFASGGFDGSVAVWDAREAGAALAVLWEAGGDPMALGLRNEIDVPPPRLVARCALPSAAYRVYDVAWHPTGALLAAACGDGAVRLLGLARSAGAPGGSHNMSVISVLTASPAWVRGAVFMCDGRALCAGCGDGRVRVWDIAAALRHVLSSTEEAATAAATVDTGHSGVAAPLINGSGGGAHGRSSRERPLAARPLPECLYLGTLDTHAAPVLRVAGPPGSDLLASISADGSLVVRRYGRTAERGPGRGGLAPVAPSGLFQTLLASRASRGRPSPSRFSGSYASPARNRFGGASGATADLGSASSYGSQLAFRATVGDEPAPPRVGGAAGAAAGAAAPLLAPSLGSFLGPCDWDDDEGVVALEAPPAAPHASEPHQRPLLLPRGLEAKAGDEVEQDTDSVGLSLDDVFPHPPPWRVRSPPMPFKGPSVRSPSWRPPGAPPTPGGQRLGGRKPDGVGSPLQLASKPPASSAVAPSSPLLLGSAAPALLSDLPGLSWGVQAMASPGSAAASALRKSRVAGLGSGAGALSLSPPLQAASADARHPAQALSSGWLHPESSAPSFALDSFSAAEPSRSALARRTTFRPEGGSTVSLRDLVGSRRSRDRQGPNRQPSPLHPSGSAVSLHPSAIALQRISRAFSVGLARAAEERFSPALPVHTYMRVAETFAWQAYGGPLRWGRQTRSLAQSPVRLGANGEGAFLFGTAVAPSLPTDAGPGVSSSAAGVRTLSQVERATDHYIRRAGGAAAIALPAARAIPPGWDQGVSPYEHDRQLLQMALR